MPAARSAALRRRPAAARSRQRRKTAEVLPRYRELGLALMADIADGVYPIGSFLPPELELCRKYRISRFTAREALRQLLEAGLVTRRQGSGTQVIAVPGKSRFVQEVGSVQDLTQYAHTTEFRVFHTGKVALDRLFARQFKAKPGEEWIFAAGLRVDRGRDGSAARPICITRVYLNPVLEGIQAHLPGRTGPIHELVEEVFGHRLTRVEQHISAVSLDRDDAVSLNERRGAPALRTLRVYFDDKDRVVEASDSIHPGDRFAYTMNLRRGPGS